MLAQDFALMVRGRRGQKLDAWMQHSRHRHVPREMRKIATGSPADNSALTETLQNSIGPRHVDRVGRPLLFPMIPPNTAPDLRDNPLARPVTPITRGWFQGQLERS